MIKNFHQIHHQNIVNICMSANRRYISEDCGDEVFYSTFFNNVTVSNGCCVQLQHLGKSCHDDLVNFLLEAPELGSKISEISTRSEKIWDKCVLVAESGSSAPQSSASIIED